MSCSSVPDAAEVRRYRGGKIVSHDMHVVEVVLNFEIVRTRLIQERERLGRSIQVETGNGVRADWLDEERHAVARELPRRMTEVREISLVQDRPIDTRRRDARQAIHLFTAERLRVLDGLGEALAEFVDARRQTPYAIIQLAMRDGIRRNQKLSTRSLRHPLTIS